MIVGGVLATVLGLDAGPQAAIAVGVGLLVGVITYAAIFTWMGLISNLAIAFALIYVFLWESLIASLIPGIEYFSVRGYTLAIMHGMDESTLDALSTRVIDLPTAIVGATVVTLLFFGLTVRRLLRMDVP
jgi:hypothetical protein